MKYCSYSLAEGPELFLYCLEVCSVHLHETRKMKVMEQLPWAVSGWHWRCSLWVLSASVRKTPTGWLQPHEVGQSRWLLGRLPVDSVPPARYNADNTLSSINSLVLYSGLRLDWRWTGSALHWAAGRSWMPWCGHTPVCGHSVYCKWRSHQLHSPTWHQTQFSFNLSDVTPQEWEPSSVQATSVKNTTWPRFQALWIMSCCRRIAFMLKSIWRAILT